MNSQYAEYVCSTLCAGHISLLCVAGALITILQCLSAY